MCVTFLKSRMKKRGKKILFKSLEIFIRVIKEEEAN